MYEELLSVGPREKALTISMILTISGEDTETLAGEARAGTARPEGGSWGSWAGGSQRPSYQLGGLGEHCM